MIAEEQTYPEKLVSEEGRLLAHILETPEIPWGQIIPLIEDK